MVVQSVDNLCQQARTALAQRELVEARDLYSQALALRQNSPDVHYGLGTVYFMMNDLHKAASHFSEAISLGLSRNSAGKLAMQRPVLAACLDRIKAAWPGRRVSR